MKQKKIIASEKKSLEKECHRRAYIKVIIAAITISALCTDEYSRNGFKLFCIQLISGVNIESFYLNDHELRVNLI